ncbi:MAG: hypothetical protein ACRD2J_09950 [Thermoanaerobaculia bacterium]
MHRQNDLLPGVEGPPSRRNTTAGELERSLLTSRRRAAVDDLVDSSMLILINLMFLLWPSAEVPLLDRDGTLALLLLVDAAAIAGWFRTRVLPVLRARRIAGTWSEAERARFRV